MTTSTDVVYFSLNQGACWNMVQLEEAIDIQNIRCACRPGSTPPRPACLSAMGARRLHNGEFSYALVMMSTLMLITLVMWAQP